ncbi:hypothetical protein TH63_09995 [Rufibacter radiotolerans]|uniref:DUF2905 domain-containing protein n=1 Tax=Rufibacter radiotolerans TaxID=1379910 RepID=A0A0H4VQ83_9BACT|nr:DUF2905 domain-containing protein [Rufibacter radiotolerans]AKQ45899.1 hypothetical protein TH63_09995 [Rufibacter radiotolerans]
MQPLGKYLVIIGAAIVVIGLVVWLAGPRLDWFGRLPGDIRVEKPGFRFYAPLTSMLLVSLLLSLVLWVIRRFFG